MQAKHKMISVSVELKSVNYRFKEVNARLPRPLLYLEDKLKQTILQYIQRGRIELFVSVDSDMLVERRLDIDWPPPMSLSYRRGYEKAISIVRRA